MTSSSVKNNKHHMLENVESPVSSGTKKAIKKIGQWVEKGNKFYLLFRGICLLHDSNKILYHAKII